MFIAGGIWCLADVSSVSPSSELMGVSFFSGGSCYSWLVGNESRFRLRSFLFFCWGWGGGRVAIIR